MRFRSTRARWFETYVPRTETVYALEVLADTGVVELESQAELAHPLKLERVRAAVAEFDRLCVRYAEILPDTTPMPAGMVEAPEVTADAALRRLRPAFARLDQLLDRRRRLQDERRNLSLLY